MIYFSAKNLSFYDDKLKSQYEKVSNWPDDLVEVTPETHQQMINIPPDKELSADDNGQPILVDKVYELSYLQDRKIKQLKGYINDELLKGYTTSNGIKMDSTEQSVQRLENGYKIAKNAGQNAMDVVDYHDKIHKDIDLTTVDSMIAELGQYVSNWYWHKQNKRQEIQAATKKSELESIDITTGE
jgi:hypothetical protein